jgi:MtN3 and saliva related transmembrane protein|tara:strand:+ start:266 stop:523 length:258 start_codon:yes stop_codon:yes gene_type:complete
MSNFNPEILGLVAAAITTFAWVPQVYKMYKERNASGVSLTMALLFFVGITLWFIYGYLIESISIMVANGITLILQSMIIIYKLKE